MGRSSVIYFYAGVTFSVHNRENGSGVGLCALVCVNVSSVAYLGVFAQNWSLTMCRLVVVNLHASLGDCLSYRYTKLHEP